MMRFAYLMLCGPSQLAFFQAFKVALWGFLVKAASLLAAFSIYKQTFARLLPSAHLMEQARILFEEYVHPIPEAIIEAVGIHPTLELKDALTLYILLGGLTARYVKAISAGLYFFLMDRQRLSVADIPFPGQQGMPEQPPPIPLTGLDWIFIKVMTICWGVGNWIARKKVTLRQNEFGNWVMDSLFSGFVLLAWPVALVYVLALTERELARQTLTVMVPHPKWEKEFGDQRIGLDSDKRVVYVALDLIPHNVLLIQLGFVATLTMLIFLIHGVALATK